VAIKNFWSLQVDEAIVAEEIKYRLGNDYEIFFPINSQLKDIDLIVYNLKKRKSKAIQVKSSRTYDWGIDEQRSWHQVKENSILKPKNKVDFFIFIWHIIKKTRKKQSMEHAYLVIPIDDLKKKIKDKKTTKDKTYHFAFWTNLKDKANDARNPKYYEIDFSEFLDNFELLKK